MAPGAQISIIGNDVASNTSDTYQVITFESTGSDLTSVVVPTTRFQSMSFQSESFGIGATCKPVTANVIQRPDLPRFNVSLYISGSVLRNNTVSFSLDNSKSFPSAFAVYNLQDTRGDVPRINTLNGIAATNPFGMAQVMQWVTFGTDEYSSLVPHEEVRLYTGVCNISIYKVALSYKNGTYSLTNRTLVTQNTTTSLFSPFVALPLGAPNIFLVSTRMVANLQSQLNKNLTDFLVEIARQVSQLGMAFNAASLIPAQATSDVMVEKDFLASRYPLNALSMLWISTVLYLILGIGLLVRVANIQGDSVTIEPLMKSSTLNSNKYSALMTSTLALAQRWVTTPSAIIAEHFILSPSDGNRSFNILAPTLSIQKSTIDMFGDELQTNRLGIGLRHRGFFVGYQEQWDLEATG